MQKSSAPPPLKRLSHKTPSPNLLQKIVKDTKCIGAWSWRSEILEARNKERESPLYITCINCLSCSES